MKKMTFLFLILTFLFTACSNFIFPKKLPVSIDNPRTAAGVQLGRMLFYEKKLSRTNDLTCASCHRQELAFSDDNRVSFGVDSLQGTRQSMPLFNLAFTQNGFFWDGRIDILRHQALEPIENELELDETLDKIIAKLSNESIYQDQFALAFGDNNITEEKIGLAVEQFLNTIVSNNSRFDQSKRKEIKLTASEQNGFELIGNSGCFTCHGSFNFDDADNRFLNNGLDTNEDMTDFGRELVTGSASDRAKFKVPSLRNIAVTAPYMHDGRFQTLEQVLDHYATGTKQSSTIAGEFPRGFNFTEEEKTDIILFFKTLTDEELLTNPDFSDPF